MGGKDLNIILFMTLILGLKFDSVKPNQFARSVKTIPLLRLNRQRCSSFAYLPGIKNLALEP